jgi:hypothetical protein
MPLPPRLRIVYLEGVHEVGYSLPLFRFHVVHRRHCPGEARASEFWAKGMSSSAAPSPAPLTPEAAAFCEAASQRPAHQELPVDVSVLHSHNLIASPSC